MFGIGTVFLLSVLVVVVGGGGGVFFFFFLAHKRIGMNRRRLYERPQWHVCDEERERERRRRRRKVVKSLLWGRFEEKGIARSDSSMPTKRRQ
jgi:hypothetical protein